jgi:hypothetical protein
MPLCAHHKPTSYKSGFENRRHFESFRKFRRQQNLSSRPI